jgi:hypothetical protein
MSASSVPVEAVFSTAANSKFIAYSKCCMIGAAALKNCIAIAYFSCVVTSTIYCHFVHDVVAISNKC